MRLTQYKSALGVGLGIIITAFGIFEDGKVDASDIRAVGVLTALSGVAWLTSRRISKPANAAYELGHAEGYRSGYQDGRKIARLTIVPTDIAESPPGQPRHRAQRRASISGREDVF
jgi:hypothetical protein